MARQSRAIHTRGLILETAAEMFNELGYEATTIGGLVERARLTRGCLYFHYTTKEQLARAVLAEAAITEGLATQSFKLQEWVDLGLLLAHRAPREPLLAAALRLSGDVRARELLGTRWPEWIGAGEELLSEARERGELLVHADPYEIARLLVGAWAGMQLLTEALPGGDLAEEVSRFFQLVLPVVATAGVLVKLDTSPNRAARLLAEARGESLAVP
ncbi:ScbR family autoregulator-binding transcription factor [Streptomyces sp. NPDC097619]|uniref:ScbR family autoregulator-binding transcription factor n=1 Tax=Streptomyces sp. NPDC097619 TaxID=3157228 RepID=UPI00331EB3C0